MNFSAASKNGNLTVVAEINFFEHELNIKNILRNNCLLISWMAVTIALSAKYIWVVVTHDWSALEVNNPVPRTCPK